MHHHRFRNGLLIFLVTGLFIWIALLIPDGPPDPPPSASVAPPAEDRIDERLLAELRPPPGREEKDGTAVAILVDTSGSMKSSVRDLDGTLRPKIEIAKRATSRLLARLKEFAAKEPGKPLAVGLYEFSGEGCRRILPLGPLDSERAARTVEALQTGKGTPIGEAMVMGQVDLGRSGLSRRHMLLVTDGENTKRRNPVLIARAISLLAPYEQAGIHFIAFDVSAEKFNGIRAAGGTVLEASDAAELDRSVDYILERKILLEMPEGPKR